LSRYKYRARNRDGAPVEGEIEASSSHQVSSLLDLKGLILVSAEEKPALLDLSSILLELNKVKLRDLSIVFRQLSVVVAAGVPLFESLSVLEEQTAGSSMKRIISMIKSDIESGSSFSASLKKHPSVFSSTVVAMVEAGEKSGTLGEVLMRISSALERENQFETKVKSALRYPVIVLTVLVIAFILAVFFIIPRFSSVFAGLKTELPLPTKILLLISSFASKYWFIVLVGIFITALILGRYLKTKKGKKFFDSMVLKLPVIGDLAAKLSLARFFRMLSDLLQSGIPASLALELTAETTGNAAISEKISTVKEEVLSGSPINLAMKKSGVFPAVAVHMTALGERSGNLPEMLGKVSSYFDEETDYVVSNLMTLIEPLFIFVLAGFVLVLALGVFMPSWNMMQLYFN